MSPRDPIERMFGPNWEAAERLFGPDVVAEALSYPAPATLDAAELRAVARRARQLGLGGLRAWALLQPWPVFCAVVRLISERESSDLLADDNEGNDDA